MSMWKEWKKSQVKPWHILNPRTEFLTDEEAKQRMDICSACPQLIQLTKQCKECGCIMPVKTKMKLAECPLGKW